MVVLLALVKRHVGQGAQLSLYQLCKIEIRRTRPSGFSGLSSASHNPLNKLRGSHCTIAEVLLCSDRLPSPSS